MNNKAMEGKFSLYMCQKYLCPASRADIVVVILPEILDTKFSFPQEKKKRHNT